MGLGWIIGRDQCRTADELLWLSVISAQKHHHPAKNKSIKRCRDLPEDYLTKAWLLECLGIY